jgi:hypothetical protein
MTLAEIAEYLLLKHLGEMLKYGPSAASGFTSLTRRVYLPDGNSTYITDDQSGDGRLLQLYVQYGNLEIEVCQKEFGKDLADAEVVRTGNIATVLCGMKDCQDEIQYVQNITVSQGIGQAVLPEYGELPDLDLCQYYGPCDLCELRDDTCSDDGILWSDGDRGGGHYCTTHQFPAEQLGYEFYSVENAA